MWLSPEVIAEGHDESSGDWSIVACFVAKLQGVESAGGENVSFCVCVWSVFLEKALVRMRLN